MSAKRGMEITLLGGDHGDGYSIPVHPSHLRDHQTALAMWIALEPEVRAIRRALDAPRRPVRK